MTNHQFNIGDIVTPKPADRVRVEMRAGVAKFGEYRVESVGRFAVNIRPVTPSSLPSGPVTVDADQLVLKTKSSREVVRVEGQEIHPDDIKVGDTIRVSKVNGEMTMMHDATVKKIKRQTDNKNYGALLFYTECQRINWGGGSDETFTLINAVKPRDLLMEKLEAAEGGTAVYSGGLIARKSKMAPNYWDVFNADGVRGLNTAQLREKLKLWNDTAEFMSPEKS